MSTKTLRKRIALVAVSAPGTTLDYRYIQVVAGCTTSTYSAADSSYETATAIDASPDGETQSTYTFVDADTAYISILAYNAYASALPTGSVIASATNGALVGVGATTPTVGVTSIASANIDGDPIYVAVEQPTSGTALSTTVTITFNGTKIYEKTILFTGDVAKLTVSGVDVQATGGATLAGIYDVTAQDAAGNYVAWAVAGDASKYDSIVTAVTGGTTAADNSGTLAAGKWTCGAKSGVTKVRLQATTNAGTTIYSNEFDAKCGGAAYTYTASLDKASYVPGDIATLTITAKDASGFAPFKGETVDAAGTAATNANILGSQMTPTAQPLMADTFDANGVKKYTFSVGSTEGNYNMAVNLGYTGNDAVSVPYTIKASSSTVTNAEVLAAIVKLIASINKQIAALQKALKK